MPDKTGKDPERESPTVVEEVGALGVMELLMPDPMCRSEGDLRPLP